jgi:MAD (mothers against decapentaplegic) interacting protein
MTTDGLSCVGQDEVVFILEVLPDEKYPPKDVFWFVNMLYQEASKGTLL